MPRVGDTDKNVIKITNKDLNLVSAGGGAVVASEYVAKKVIKGAISAAFSEIAGVAACIGAAAYAISAYNDHEGYQGFKITFKLKYTQERIRPREMEPMYIEHWECVDVDVSRY